MRFLGAFIILFYSLVGSLASAGTNLSIDSIHKRSITLNFVSKRVVPLPAGDWEIIQSVGIRTSAGTVIRRIFLVKIENNTLVGQVNLIFPEEIARNGYARSRYCDRSDVHFEKVYGNYAGREQDCYVVNHLRPTLQGSRRDAINEIGDKLIKRGITWPHHLISVKYHFADTSEFLDIWYMVNPTVFGFENFSRSTWASSPWHQHSIVEYPKRKEFVNAFIDWSKSTYPMIKRTWEKERKDTDQLPRIKYGNLGKKSALGGAIEPKTAGKTKEKMNDNSVISRLNKIKSLLKAGLITKEEAAQKRKSILDGM